MTYIVQADLEDRLTAVVIRQILDDDVSGAPDANPLARALADAESYVEGFLRVAYNLTTIRALGVNVPNEIKRMCLDVATAYLWERHPEYVRADGDKLLARVRSELEDLRRGFTRLDIVGAPEPPTNRGGEPRSGDPDDTDTADKFFNDPNSFGIY
jgi:phage gp36-like protein